MKKITTVNGEQYTIKDTDRFVSMTDKLPRYSCNKYRVSYELYEDNLFNF